MLVHRPSKHLLAEPFLNIEKTLSVDYICDFIRNELPHFFLNVNVLEEVHGSICVHVIRVVVQQLLFSISKALYNEEPVACEIVKLRSGHTFP